MLQSYRSMRSRGFTLVELLVVIAVVAVLIGLLLPAVQNAREAANRMSCTNNLRQLAIAAHHFHDSHGKFPPGVRLPVLVRGRPTGGTNLWVELLPYFEQDNLYKKWDYDDNRNNVAGERDVLQAQVIKILLCPSDPLPEHVVHATAEAAPPWSWGFYAMTSYGGNAGRRSFHPGDPPAFPRLTRDGIFSFDTCVRLADITDGTSNTFLFGERFHRDPEFERRKPLFFPHSQSSRRLGEVGFRRQGHRARHAPHRRADQLPGATRGRLLRGGESALRRWQRPSGRRQLRLRRWLRAFRERPHSPANAPSP